MRVPVAVLAAAACLALAGPAGAAVPGADGRIVFSAGADLHTILPDGGGLTPLTATAGEEEAQAAWSPDGARVAFRVGRPGTSDVLQIAVMNADGTGRTVITAGALHSSQPSWAPDGRHLVFRRSVPGDNLSGDLWMMGADGADPRPLVTLPGDERYPSLSPDGGWLTFTTHPSAADDVEIAVARADGAGAAAITDNALFDSSPAWSPDGRRIAFERGPKGDDPGNDVWTMAPDGSEQRQLTTSPGLDEGPAWAPSGARIAFTSTRAGSSDIWTMAADGSDQRALTALPGTEESPDWQPLPVAPTGPSGPGPGPGPTPAGTVPDPCPHRVGGRCDRDGDGLSDLRERGLGTSPLDRDSDDDGLSDGREVRAARTSPRRRDTDRDGLADGLELGVTRGVADPEGVVRGTDLRRFRPDADPRTRTDPRRRDTDRDGVPDGREDRDRDGRRDPGETDPRVRD